MSRNCQPNIHRRRSIRLRGYDYGQPGAYFVTVCANIREPIFGEVIDGEMHLNPLGGIVQEEWMRSAQIRANIEMGEVPTNIRETLMTGLLMAQDKDGERVRPIIIPSSLYGQIFQQ